MADVEEEVLASDSTQDTLQLDCLIGHIENIILSDEFAALRENFLEQHCQVFDDEDENKLEYMDIFKQYTSLIEGHIERELSARESGFKMAAFLQELSASHALDGEVFDLLITFTDFLAFKTAMLEIKQSKEDGSAKLEDLLQITSLNS
ncbi:ADP-ribosylation factor-like protein 2-binding protein [Homarus americanus]|uniref:ADP-ribosylation factor-like protein 2-binding protein n=1 Tax=Homarus americanus TaxID=6706 RepID=A0A8J5K6L0_HOMAM|nr:ADP-ribosylation factor-like protein 2-binding protein [Homarus americanus]KAG7170476.1 ADP-ribosylation factor-like protein 2-binding protein-like [Homarus americanus]